MRGRHYFYFGKRLSDMLVERKMTKDSWEILRNDSFEGPFALEKNKEEYEKNCEVAVEYKAVADIIAEEIKKDCKSIISCGVGKGILEWNLKELMPKVLVECTDYTPEAIDRLKSVFVKCDGVRCFDMINGDYCLFRDYDCLIMYRVSTEFDKATWKRIFGQMRSAGIKRVCFVPTELATWKQIVKETIKHTKNKVRKRKDTFCGWLYSEKEFYDMWKEKYYVEKRIEHGNTAIFFLKIVC